jgi:hypothetical protein
MKIKVYIALYLNSADGKEKYEFKILCTIGSLVLRQVSGLD